MQKFVAFWKVHQRHPLLIAGELSTLSILNAESFHLRWIDIHLEHSSGGPRSLLSPFHFKLLNYSPLILPELCTAGAPLAVLILARKDRWLYATFTYVWIINPSWYLGEREREGENRFNSLSRYHSWDNTLRSRIIYVRLSDAVKVNERVS